jgi:hypothetical protein
MLWRIVMVSSPIKTVFHYKPHDPLAFIDTERISRSTQAGEERREGFREAQEGRSIIGRSSDCL